MQGIGKMPDEDHKHSKVQRKQGFSALKCRLAVLHYLINAGPKAFRQTAAVWRLRSSGWQLGGFMNKRLDPGLVLLPALQELQYVVSISSKCPHDGASTADVSGYWCNGEHLGKY